MAKDYTKYQVEGLEGQYSKARLVQAVIQDYITKNNPTLEQLKTAFPDSLQGGKGLIAQVTEIEKERYFYVKEPITLSDGTQIALGNQWGKGNIDNFITHAKTLGYSIFTAAVVKEEDSALDEEQIASFKEQEAELNEDYVENEWDAFSLHDELIEAGDTAWADRILQKIEQVAEEFSTFETICEKLQERNEKERLLAMAKKAEAKADGAYSFASLANIISQFDKAYALALYQKAEELAEDFSDMNNLGDSYNDYLGDKENALRLQRKAMLLIETKWNKNSLIRSLEALEEAGKDLLAVYMDNEDKSTPRMDLPKDLFASYHLPWGRFLSLRFDNAPDCDTMSFRILLDMKEQKILGKANEDNKFRRWFDEREVRLFDDFVKLKSYDGVLTISGGYSKHIEDWQISCHTGFEELLEGELPKDATGEELYNAVGKEGEVYQLYRYLLENADESGIKVGLSEEDIAALTEADSGYNFSEILQEALDKDQLDALDYEPLLIEMAKENTLKGKAFNLDLATIAGWVNQHFGNLCYRAYYGEEGITKTNLEYAASWGELVTALAERAETDTDYINLASCVQMQFTAFEDKDECKRFAHENYSKAIEAMDDVQYLVGLVGGHLNEEYYENEELTTKAGIKALASASTFQDYATICFDDSERCLFNNTDIYKTAAAKAVKLIDQADEYEIEHFKRMLEEWEDDENLGKL